MSPGRKAGIFLVRCAARLMLILGLTTSAAAAEFTVNSGFDQSDLEPGNGLCVAYLVVFPPFALPFCTLRAAIEEANALPGPDIINIPSGNYLLDIAGINEGTVRMTNTIIAGNAETNCFLSQPIDSLGNNLEDSNSCLLDAPTDIINTDPRLDPLQDHGGPTLTHGLLIGSPAVDRGRNLAPIGITMDQRGVRRPDGDAYDIGAFETRKRSVVPLFAPLLGGDKKE